jgi:hypothetical protein
MAASFVLTAAGVAAVLLPARFSLLDDAVQASGGSEVVRSVEEQRFAFGSGSLDPAAGMTREPSAQVDEPAQEEASAWAPTIETDADAVGETSLAEPQAQHLLGSETEGTSPQHDWATYHNDRFGFAIDYPADVFAVDDRTLGDFWRLFVSRDGQARLLVTAGFNSKRLSTASYRQAVINETYQGSNLVYAPLRKTWFVLAGDRGEEGFYERATFACDGRIIHRWRLTYPAGERPFYTKIIERIHQGYKHIRGAGPHCG